MSWASFDRLLSDAPQLRSVAIEAARAFAAAKAGIDPLVVAKRLGVGELEVLATIALLMRAGLGAWVIQVLNQRGQPVGEFPSIAETPPTVEDDYGDEIVVASSNTRIVFRSSDDLVVPVAA